MAVKKNRSLKVKKLDWQNNNIEAEYIPMTVGSDIEMSAISKIDFVLNSFSYKQIC